VTYFIASGFCNFFTSVMVALLILFRTKRREEEVTFGLFCLSIAVWSLFYTVWLTADNPEAAHFHCKSLMAGAIPITVFLYHFVALLTDNKEREWNSIVIGYVLSGFLWLANFSNLVVAGVEPRLFFPFWPIPGPLFHVYTAMFAFMVYKFFALLIRKLRVSTGIKREQVKYLLLGSAIGFPGGSTNFLLWYNIPVPAYGNILVSVYIAVIAYAILKYRLMDINLAFRFGLVYFFNTVLVAVPLAVLILAIDSSAASAALAFAGIMAATYLFARFKDKWTVAVDLLPPFRGRYIAAADVRRFQSIIAGARTVDEWAWRVMDAVERLFKSRHAAVLFRTGAAPAYTARAAFGMNPADLAFLSLSTDSPVARRLSAHALFIRDTEEHAFPPADAAQARLDLDRLRCALAAPLAGEGAPPAFLVLGPKADGGMYNALDIRALRDFARGAEDALRALLTASEREARVRERLAAVGEAASLAGHEVRNALAAIGHAAYMLENKLDDPAHQRHVGNISAQVAASQRILGDILNFVRDRELVLMKTALADILPEVFEAARLPADVRLEVQVPPDLPPLWLDRGEMRQALENLRRNAVEAMPDGGTLRATASVRGDSVRLSVSDTGGGIAPENLEKMFSPLFTTKPGGTGLGLMGVKRTIERHRGRVSVESALGRGTTFHIDLPAPAADRRGRASTKTEVVGKP